MLLCKKIKRAPGGHIRFMLTKLGGGGGGGGGGRNRIDPKNVLIFGSIGSQKHDPFLSHPSLTPMTIDFLPQQYVSASQASVSTHKHSPVRHPPSTWQFGRPSSPTITQLRFEQAQCLLQPFYGRDLLVKL